MAAYINTNIASLNSQRNLNSSQNAMATSLQRLSSGLRINSAKDDAAGLAISERMTTQIRGLNQAARNANDGISLAQTAEGTLGEIGNNLQRIRELAVQSRNATNSADDRAALQKEVDQLKAEINRVAGDTKFNGIKLLDGSFTKQQFQVGADKGQTIEIASITDARTSSLGSWNKAGTTTGATLSAGGGAATAGKAVFDASTLIGVDFSTDNVTFDVATGSGSATTVTLDGNYATAGDLKTALEGKLSGYTISNTGNSFTITAGSTGTGTQVNISNFTSANSSVSAMPSVTSSDGAAAGGSSLTQLSGNAFTINGQNIEVGAATTAAGRLSDLVSAINASSANVKAEVDGDKLKLTSNDPAVDLVVGGADAAVVLAQTGLTADTYEGTAQTGFANLDITSVDGADDAILAMDGALKAVNDARANLGAIQNRFSSVVANLQTTSENMAASRSRIQDTDFAAETASLTRAQILQQAGTAMLAQANSLPNSVLSLLRG